ncbi:hypothetical protein YB2330_001333 [Saitoella coloradoensis]
MFRVTRILLKAHPAPTVNPVATANVIANATSASPNSFHIPIINFEPFLSGSRLSKETVAQEVLSGFVNSGFIYLKGWEKVLSKDVVNKTFAESARFFARPTEEKAELLWMTPESNRGYVAAGRERVSRLDSVDEIEKLKKANPDIKESMEIGKEMPAGTPKEFLNRWPQNDSQFKSTMTNFFETCHNLHLEVLSSIAMGLGLEPRWFDHHCDAKDHNLRLLHYPSVDKDQISANKSNRAGAHTDYGTITLLFQDSAGGLEVLSPTGQYIAAPPIPGTIIVNAGDLLARWSNDRIMSTEHRVVTPASAPESDVYPARYSIAFFANPNYETEIEALEGTFRDGGEKKYEKINTLDYLVQRLTATYGKK